MVQSLPNMLKAVSWIHSTPKNKDKDKKGVRRKKRKGKKRNESNSGKSLYL